MFYYFFLKEYKINCDIETEGESSISSSSSSSLSRFPTAPLDSIIPRDVWIDRLTLSYAPDYLFLDLLPAFGNVFVASSATVATYYTGSLPFKTLTRSSSGPMLSGEVDAVITAITWPGCMIFLDRSMVDLFISSLKTHRSPISLSLTSDTTIYDVSSMLDGGCHTENVDVIRKAIKASGIPPQAWSVVFIGTVKKIPVVNYDSPNPEVHHILHKHNLDIDREKINHDPFFVLLDSLLKYERQPDVLQPCCFTFDIRIVFQGTENTIPLVSLNVDYTLHNGRQYPTQTTLHYFTLLADCLSRGLQPNDFSSKCVSLKSPGTVRLYLDHTTGGDRRGKMPLKNESTPSKASSYIIIIILFFKLLYTQSCSRPPNQNRILYDNTASSKYHFPNTRFLRSSSNSIGKKRSCIFKKCPLLQIHARTDSS